MAARPSQGYKTKAADSSTIQEKFLVGYQGWFTCPGDGEPLDPHHHGWLHWFTHPMPDGGRPNTDLWPDTSEYSPSELFPASGLKLPNGEQAFLFSSRHPKTVQRHFHWMAQHGVDGAFLQRFVGQCDVERGNLAIRNQRDEVGDRVREAAEKEGRVFAIMYDFAGVPPDRIQHIIEQDWPHLIYKKQVLDSPSYLREKGKAVVTLWGLGMNDQNHDPRTVRAITQFIRANTPGGAYIIAGTPAYWRTATNDADRNPEFLNVYLECFDAISPWTIGRYNNPDSADWFARELVKPDLDLIRSRNEDKSSQRQIDYMPVVHPGGSGYNLSEGQWKWNDAPRHGGRYLWRQLHNVRSHGVRMIYGAMWDEYDEGTAYMPVVSQRHQTPAHEKYRFMALDEDGYVLPSDWYMRICGFAAESLKGRRELGEEFPEQELRDYWEHRTRDTALAGEGMPYHDWEKAAKDFNVPEEAPPPYEPWGGASTSQRFPPPPPDRSTRPGPSQQSHSRPAAPPPVNPGSRPARPSDDTSGSDTASSVSVDSVTEALQQQSISDRPNTQSPAPPLAARPSLHAPPLPPFQARPHSPSTYGPPAHHPHPPGPPHSPVYESHCYEPSPPPLMPKPPVSAPRPPVSYPVYQPRPHQSSGDSWQSSQSDVPFPEPSAGPGTGGFAPVQQPWGEGPYMQAGPPPPEPYRYPTGYGAPPPPQGGYYNEPGYGYSPPQSPYAGYAPQGPPPPMHPQYGGPGYAPPPQGGSSLSSDPVGYALRASKDFYRKHLK